MPEINSLLSRFPARSDNLIPILHSAQRELGYLSRETIEHIASYINLSTSTVYSVATFYSAFRFAPSGKHCIKVCRGTACHIKGAEQVLNELETRLDIRAGNTTADGEYTLETEACFGSCALAPVAVKDGRVYGRVTPSTVGAILRDDC